MKSALSQYTRPPNPLSLSTHFAIPDDIFGLYASGSPELIRPLHEYRESGTPEAAPPDATPSCTSVPKSDRIGSRRTIGTEPNAVPKYEEILAKASTAATTPASDRAKAKPATSLLKELRWANLGWVYQWTIKAYDFTVDNPIPFPADLKSSCQKVVKDIPWPQVFDGPAPDNYLSWADDYEPDTGIVNFYQLNDTLMGHVDRAELDPSRPLVSIS